MFLSDEQIEAVKRGEAVRFSADNVEMVVVRADIYDRMINLGDADLTRDELRNILARSAADSDWTGPQMDLYDDYDKHHK